MSATPALQIRILDLKMQAYLQHYPFADGPDAAMNASARQAIAAGLTLRPAAPDLTPIQLAPAQTVLPERDAAAVDRLLTQIRIPAARQPYYRNDFAWEANLIPRTAKNVLVIGCGDGMELLFLRAVLPAAAITAIDYGNTLLPGLQDAVGFRFLQGDMNTHLRSLTREYDLVFSNHTMEHLYTPDEMLALLTSLLLPLGHLAAVLPMAGKPGVPFLRRIHAAAGHGTQKPTHPMDMVFLDAGHPWKTNPGDLKQTFEGAGLTGVTLYQRVGHLSRPLRLSPALYKLARATHSISNTLLFAPIRAVCKLAPRSPKLARLLLAIERRTLCGTNRVMNLFAEEAFVIGQMPAC